MTRIRFFRFFCGVVLTVLCLVVRESPASTTGAVGAPAVEKGKAAAEIRLGYSADEKSSPEDERLRTRIHYDYGLTGLYAFRLVLAGDRRKGNGFEADSIGVENRFHLLKKKDHGFDFGVRLNYVYKDGDKKPDRAAIGAYELIPFGESWELRLNQIFAHATGPGSVSGISFESRIQATYKISDAHRLGFENFSDFGRLNDLSGFENQAHTLGPVLKGKLGHGFSYETGYRAGISAGAPDHSLKFFLAKAF